MGNITSKCTPESMCTPMNGGRRGDRAKRGMIHWSPYGDVLREHGAPVTIEYESGPFLTGMREQYFHDPLTGADVKRPVLTVLEHKPKSEKRNNRTGPRRHHRAPSLNYDGFFEFWMATEIVERAKKRAKRGKGSKRKVYRDEDGCFRVSVADPRRTACKELGIPLENKHTVNPNAFDTQAGPLIPSPGYVRPQHHPSHKPLAKAKPTIVTNAKGTWSEVSVEEYVSRKGNKLKLYDFKVSNGEYSKHLIIPQCQNVKEARVMLKTIHGIE